MVGNLVTSVQLPISRPARSSFSLTRGSSGSIDDLQTILARYAAATASSISLSSGKLASYGLVSTMSVK
jgi:hypothetical protein